MSPGATLARPRAAVVGVGNYYRKLRPFLHDQFEVVSLVDVRRPDLDPADEAVFKEMPPDAPLPGVLPDVDICFVFSPHEHHARQTLELLAASVPVMVEKPPAVTLPELGALGAASGRGGVLFSDAFVDVRSPMLLQALGADPDPYASPLAENPEVAPPSGPVEAIRAKFIEADTLFRTDWKHLGPTGGVILDLHVHWFALIRRLFPDEDLAFASVTVEWYDRSAGQYTSDRPSPDAAEARATITGRLTPSGIPVDLVAATNGAKQKRWFEVATAGGTWRQDYREGHPLRVATARGRFTARTPGSHHEWTVHRAARWLAAGAPTFGWGPARWATEKALEALAAATSPV